MASGCSSKSKQELEMDDFDLKEIDFDEDIEVFLDVEELSNKEVVLTDFDVDFAVLNQENTPLSIPTVVFVGEDDVLEVIQNSFTSVLKTTTTKNIMTCENCGKKYISNGFYKLHIINCLKKSTNVVRFFSIYSKLVVACSSSAIPMTFLLTCKSSLETV